MTRYECHVCGLAACDLPDEVDPELFFEWDDGIQHCPTCVLDNEYEPSEARHA